MAYFQIPRGSWRLASSVAGRNLSAASLKLGSFQHSVTSNPAPQELFFSCASWLIRLEAMCAGFPEVQATGMGKFKARRTFWKDSVGCVCLLFVGGGDVCLAFAREGVYLWVLEATSCSHPVDSGIFSHCQQFYHVIRA